MQCTIRVATFTFLAGLLTFGSTAPAQPPIEYCQILDRIEDPIWQGYLGFATREQVDVRGKFGLIEMGAHSGLLYWRTDYGDLDFRAGFDTLFFAGSAGMNLPAEVTAARLDLAYILRYEEGYALRLGMKPGFYSELSGMSTDSLAFPFSVTGIRAITPSASVLAGLHVDPGFKRMVVPEVGVRWAISDYLLLDAFYPESRLVFRPNMDWSIRTGFAFREFLEYSLERGDDRKALIYDEMRLYVGVDRMISEGVQVMVEMGRLVNRSIDFRRMERERDVDDAFYVRIGVGGRI